MLMFKEATFRKFSISRPSSTPYQELLSASMPSPWRKSHQLCISLHQLYGSCASACISYTAAVHQLYSSCASAIQQLGNSLRHLCYASVASVVSQFVN